MKFQFYNDLVFKLIIIPKEINSEEEMFDLYGNRLQFPWYFGNNWDAFNDSLCDLDWLSEKLIIIQHLDIPFMKSNKNQKSYFGILYNWITHWEQFEDHKIEIFFPKEYEIKIKNLLFEYKIIR